MLVAATVLTGGWAIIVTLVALTITHVAATSLGISRTRTGRIIVTTAKGGWPVGGGVVSSLPTGRAEKWEKCWSGKCVV